MKLIVPMELRPAMLLCRLRWMGYRCRAVLGMTGLVACAVLLAAVGIELVVIAPSVRQHDVRLVQLASGQASVERELARLREENLQRLAATDSGGDLWDILDRHHLSPGEVKHRQLAGKKTSTEQARNLISLPSTGNYSHFRAALKELDTLPDVAVETFSLSRKSHADRLLAIELTLSVSAAADQLSKQEVPQ